MIRRADTPYGREWVMAVPPSYDSVSVSAYLAGRDHREMTLADLGVGLADVPYAFWLGKDGEAEGNVWWRAVVDYTRRDVDINSFWRTPAVRFGEGE